MTSRLSLLLLTAFLIASCTPGSAPAATATPLTAPLPTPEPPSYARSLLLARWDSETHHHLLAPVDPATGDPIADHDSIDLGVNYYYLFSPDHSTLAVLSYPDDSASDPTLHVIDLASWKEEKYPLELTGWVSASAFSTDGRRLAIAAMYRERTLLVFDLPSGTVTAQAAPEFEISALRFTRDGSSLMAYGRVLVDRFTENERSEGPAQAALFNADDLSAAWSVELTGVLDGLYAVKAGSTDVHTPGNGWYFYPGVVFAPDADALYVVHADQDRLTHVDFTAGSFHTLDIHHQVSLLERFLMLGTLTAHAKAGSGVTRQAVISPDGQVIYTAGTRNEMHQLSNGDWSSATLGLELLGIRVTDGTILMESEVPSSGLRISPEGDRLFIQGWTGDALATLPQTTIFDIQTAAALTQIKSAYAAPARRMDGTLVLVSNEVMDVSGQLTRMGVHDFESGAWIADWTSPGIAAWLVEP